MSIARQLLYGLALLAAFVLYDVTQQQRIKAANSRADLATERQHQAEQRSASQATAIASLEQALGTERAAQAGLREQQDQLRQTLAIRNQKIKELTRENAELREWAAQLLPAVARRLRERPAITGADGYQRWLSSRDAMQPAASDAGQ